MFYERGQGPIKVLDAVRRAPPPQQQIAVRIGGSTELRAAASAGCHAHGRQHDAVH